MHETEINIDTGLVKHLLTGQFPALAERPINLVQSTGTVNAIFRIGDDLCARLPRMGSWAESLVKEYTWLPKLAPYISLAIPRPFAKGNGTNYFPYPWAIYHWIDGLTYRKELINDELQMAQDLANFILELRNIEIAGAPHGGRDPLSELDGVTRIAIESSNGVIDSGAVLDAWTESLEAPRWDGKPVWIHGDLLKSNLLVQEGRLCTVIDFGGAGIGDPAADVVPAWSVFNKAGRERFRQVLDVDEGTWRRARGYALHQALLIIPYYSKTNPEFVSMAKRTVAEVFSEFK